VSAIINSSVPRERWDDRSSIPVAVTFNLLGRHPSIESAIMSTAKSHPRKDPKGGLTAAGRKCFARTEGAPRPGVKKPERDMTAGTEAGKTSGYYLPKAAEMRGGLEPTLNTCGSSRGQQRAPRPEAARLKKIDALLQHALG
jgi:hypothetical protein